MLIITLIAVLALFSLGALLFIDCKIVEDLPKENSFRKWWRRHIIAPDPEG